jgi:hypothetical protein
MGSVFLFYVVFVLDNLLLIKCELIFNFVFDIYFTFGKM